MENEVQFAGLCDYLTRLEAMDLQVCERVCSLYIYVYANVSYMLPLLHTYSLYLLEWSFVFFEHLNVRPVGYCSILHKI